MRYIDACIDTEKIDVLAVVNNIDALKIAHKICDNLEYNAAELIIHEHLKSNRHDEHAIAMVAEINKKIDRPDLALRNFQTAALVAEKVGGGNGSAYQQSIDRLGALIDAKMQKKLAEAGNGGAPLAPPKANEDEGRIKAGAFQSSSPYCHGGKTRCLCWQRKSTRNDIAKMIA